MKRATFIFSAVFLMFLPTAVRAAINVQATIDYVTMTLEDEAQILVSVDGGSSSEPVAPQVPGLDIIPSGKQTQFSFVNGTMSYHANYRFTVIPSDKGEYTIPAFIVYAEGVEYKSNSLKLTITAANYAQKPPQYLNPQSNSPSKNQNTQTQNSLDQNIQDQIDSKMNQATNSDAPFWVATEVNKVNPFVSEQILYRLKFFSRVNVNLDDVDLPDFHDFYAEVVVPEQKGRENINGQTYTTYEIVYALTPMKAGQFHIEEAQVGITYRDPNVKSSGVWDPFGSMGKLIKKNLRSPSLEMEVRSLPEPIPHDFANIVGKFSLQASATPMDLNLGESTKLTLEIAGLGNLKDAVLPIWSIANFKIYSDKPLLDKSVSPEGLQSIKTFQLALVPTAAGELSLSGLTLSYLDSETEEYVQLSVDPMKFVVKDQNSNLSNQTAVFANSDSNSVTKNQESKNIFGLYDFDEKLQFLKVKQIPDFLYILLVFVMPVFILLIPVFKKLNLPRSSNVGKRKKLKQSFVALRRVLNDSESKPQDVYKAIKVVISERLGVDVLSLTAQEIQNRIEFLNLNLSKKDQLFNWLNRFELQTYSYQKSSLSDDDVKELLNLIQEVVL